MKKNLYKIMFDILMLVIFPFLYFVNITGNMWHEILGLVLIGFIIIHLVYNYKWIAKIRNFKLSTNLTNIGLLGSFIVLAITGIRASHSLFTFTEKAGDIYIKLHLIFALISILLITIHIFLHRKFIKGIFTKQMKIQDKIGKTLFVFFILASVLFIACATYRAIPKIIDGKSQNTENKGVENKEHKQKNEEKK